MCDCASLLLRKLGDRQSLGLAVRKQKHIWEAILIDRIQNVRRVEITINLNGPIDGGHAARPRCLGYQKTGRKTTTRFHSQPTSFVMSISKKKSRRTKAVMSKMSLQIGVLWPLNRTKLQRKVRPNLVVSCRCLFTNRKSISWRSLPPVSPGSTHPQRFLSTPSRRK